MSLVFYDEIVIVNVVDEGWVIFVLGKLIGEEVWKVVGGVFELLYNILVILCEYNEFVVVVFGEVWGLNFDNGKFCWYVEINFIGNVFLSLILDGDLVYLFGGYCLLGSYVFFLGNRGDIGVNEVWLFCNSFYVVIFFLYEGYFYWIDDCGIVYCFCLSDGEEVYCECVEGLICGGCFVYVFLVFVNGWIYVVSCYDGIYVFFVELCFEIFV